jgi:hypothetical protein
MSPHKRNTHSAEGSRVTARPPARQPDLHRSHRRRAHRGGTDPCAQHGTPPLGVRPLRQFCSNQIRRSRATDGRLSSAASLGRLVNSHLLNTHQYQLRMRVTLCHSMSRHDALLRIPLSLPDVPSLLPLFPRQLTSFLTASAPKLSSRRHTATCSRRRLRRVGRCLDGPLWNRRSPTLRPSPAHVTKYVTVTDSRVAQVY